MTASLPPLGTARDPALPVHAEYLLPNGLTVLAVRRPGIPMVEVRLWVPFARADLAQTALLTQTLFSGTDAHTAMDVAARLQSVGGALTASADSDRLQVSGNCLSMGLGTLLEVLAEVLGAASYPEPEVHTGRSRLADRLRIALSQPAQVVREALLERIYGSHPYRWQIPTVERVREVWPEQLRALHAHRMRPRGAYLVLVGDLDLDRAVSLAARWLGGWAGGGEPVVLPPVPRIEPGPLILADRPGAVQSSVRVAMSAAQRLDPDCAPLQLANLIFGGYFCSRWVENIREDKGYTYSPFSRIDHSLAGSNLIAYAEVATGVTAPTLVETFYELGRIALLPPTRAEVEQARQYALGALMLAMSTQAGLAGLAANLVGFGLRLDFLVAHAGRVASATVDDVHRVAAAYLAPARSVTVILGDRSEIAPSLSTIVTVP